MFVWRGKGGGKQGQHLPRPEKEHFAVYVHFLGWIKILENLQAIRGYLWWNRIFAKFLDMMLFNYEGL